MIDKFAEIVYFSNRMIRDVDPNSSAETQANRTRRSLRWASSLGEYVSLEARWALAGAVVFGVGGALTVPEARAVAAGSLGLFGFAVGLATGALAKFYSQSWRRV